MGIDGQFLKDVLDERNTVTTEEHLVALMVKQEEQRQKDAQQASDSDGGASAGPAGDDGDGDGGSPERSRSTERKAQDKANRDLEHYKYRAALLCQTYSKSTLALLICYLEHAIKCGLAEEVRTKAPSFCCAPTVFLSKTVPCRAACLSVRLDS
eukprot:SAG22_NODE_853_length_6848_cov_6.656394_2_plen_154_part_00